MMKWAIRSSRGLIHGRTRKRTKRSWAQIFADVDRLVRDDSLFLKAGLTLEMIGEAAGLNRTYVSRAISSEGKTFFSYINDYRIRRAFELLSTASHPYSLNELAVNSGFRDGRQMNKYVQAAYGVTSTVYFSKVRPFH